MAQKDNAKSVMSILSLLQQHTPSSKKDLEIEEAAKKKNKKPKLKEDSVFQQPGALDDEFVQGVKPNRIIGSN